MDGGGELGEVVGPVATTLGVPSRSSLEDAHQERGCAGLGAVGIGGEELGGRDGARSHVPEGGGFVFDRVGFGVLVDVEVAAQHHLEPVAGGVGDRQSMHRGRSTPGL